MGTRSGEVTELHQQLVELERRVAEAEAALPHLLALGQRTVNGLLTDARIRGRQIIEESRAQVAQEIEEQRGALAEEAKELDFLRLAVAAEAMGLEQVRAQLEQAVAQAQLPATPPLHEVPVSGPRPLAASSVVCPAMTKLPLPPSAPDLVSAGMSDPSRPKIEPSTRFADAWAAGEDQVLSDAFDRFFTAAVGPDPQRDAAVDTIPGDQTEDDAKNPS